MFYHPFKKTVKSKSGKTTKRWYYWWKDPVTGIQHQKIILNFSNKSEAYVFISKLPDPTNEQRKITVNEIAKNMFLPDSEHVKRLNLLGKKLSARTLDKTMVMKYVDSHYLSENDFIFQRDDGRPLRQEYLESVFHKVIEKAGIDTSDRKLCPHSFRFTYVTRMRRNVDAETVQKMVGHSSVEMTEYYTRAAIPEMVAGLNPARQAVNMLFDKR